MHCEEKKETKEKIMHAIEAEAEDTRKKLKAAGLNARKLGNFVASLLSIPQECLSVSTIETFFHVYRHSVLSAAIKFAPKKYRANWTRDRIDEAIRLLAFEQSGFYDRFGNPIDFHTEFYALAGV